MLAFSIDYYGIFFGATQSVELFCTYGPFKLVGGIAKDHPNEEDMKNAADFVKGLH